jgi:acyl transferase domain-containing protein/NAD(P)H-dependent flavin oxidoreductase YrpB (nitropropane dioxygenase family)/NAD(P)-dependent dehydrogenase (short-subunit alcohol dehydrogenase family)/acyl carrier protein
LAACIRSDGWYNRQWLGWRYKGFTCIYDFGDISDPVLCRHYIEQMGSESASIHGLCIRMMIDDVPDLNRLVADKPSFKAGTIILAIPQQKFSAAILEYARRIAGRVFVEVYNEEMVLQSRAFNPDGFVIRGNEAGGICSSMSNPMLLRRIREKTPLPIWIYGGIGIQSALAYAIGGADGVVLSDGLLLIPELAGDLKEQDRRALTAGIRTQAVDIGNGLHVRIGESYPELINRIKVLCAAHDQARFRNGNETGTCLSDVLDVMRKHRVAARCFVGEEAAWAQDFGRRYATVPDLMQELQSAMRNHHALLKKKYPLSRCSALAKELKTEFPILQGPMTHVSDCPEFLARVAQIGAVPFAALALSKGERLEELMRETQEIVKGKTWGVGILGFAPRALQEEQMALIEKYGPDIAIVAGGRPSHYQTLRSIGIIPFLHIPVPSMIDSFFKDGVRHFIFEGRGCGGHIGPINSFALWQSAIIAFQQLAAEGEDLSDVRIAFAGGIYDAPSAAMASAFCAPLLEHGVQFGFIVGTAYLFTREILESAAITSIFQKVALNSERTVILEARTGHAIRCAPTELTSNYYREKADLLNQGMEPVKVNERLEKIYIGRLRLAAKGVKRVRITDGREEVTTVAEADQIKEGLFMVGEAAGMIDHVLDMADLHRSICRDAVRVLRGGSPEFSHPSQIVETPVKIKPTDIAIVGMAILAPGSEDLDKFWHNILAQLCFIDKVPEDRWRPSVNFNPDPENPDTAYSTKGGFLSGVPIDCMEYGIPPGSVPHIEPAQLLALEAVKQALFDAGYGDKDFDRTRTSVFFGFAGGGDLLLAYTVRAALKEYLSRTPDIPDAVRERVIGSLNNVLPQWTEDSFPGILGNVIAGRVANRFNLNGLNFTVDAACASSMAALQVACQELAYGVTRMAIVGGVDASQHIFGYTCFSKSKALSLSGRSNPFSPEADGIVLGEGVGIVVLKPLADAIRDADRIYAVIKGVGGSSDGKGSGMTVPRSQGQELAIERACEVAGFQMDTVDLIEAHGTGTPLGDRVELETIRKVQQNHDATQPCAIGSIKSAIGHTKGAAGVIGVIKAALALQHKVLPAQVNAESMPSAVAGLQSRLYLNNQNRPWFRKTPQRPRRAGVSAFGFGGTNFHTLLEEHGSHAHDPAELPQSLWPAELLLFAAPDTQTLVKGIDAAIGFLDNADASLAGFAFRHYLRQTPSAEMPVRMAVKAQSMEQLKERLIQSRKLAEDGALRPGSQESKNALYIADGIWSASADNPVGPLTALFPGQGSQKLQMLRDLAVVFPVVRVCLENANAVLADEFFPVGQGVLTDNIYPPGHENTDEKKQALDALIQTQVAQPALAAVEMALFYLLALFNVRTSMAAGHSFGELTALWSAGVMSDRQLLTLAGERGRIMSAASQEPTGMVAVHIDRNALSAFIDTESKLTISNHNTPRQVVVSGSIESLERLEAYCRQQKWGFMRLAVSQGFHSPYMANSGEQWNHALARQQFLPPRFPVFSNLTAKPYGGSSSDIAGTLGQHLLNGVAFVDQIEAMHAAGARTFLEIGPGSILTNFVEAILTNKPHHAVAAQPREDVSGVDLLLDCLAALHACGYPVDLRPAYACRRIKAKEKTNRQSSATLFLVDGGRAKPTVTVKTKKKHNTDPAMRDNPPQTRPSHHWTAMNPEATAAKPLVTTAPHPGHTEGAPDPGYTMPSKHRMPEAPDTAYVPAATRLPFNNQEKLQQLKHFQKSMHLFLETQERIQKQRIEMMEKMWNVNRQLVQNLLGSAHPVTLPADFDFASRSEPEKSTLNDGAFPDKAARTAPRTNSYAGDGSFPASAPLPDIGTDEDDSFRSSEKAVQTVPADYRSLLFEIISERTQYPPEMLAPDQDIEADLGIDSIKRVEIITMLRDTHPSLNDIADEKYYEDMAQLKTLGDIVSWIDKTFGKPHLLRCQPSEIPLEKASGDRNATQREEKLNGRQRIMYMISEKTKYPVELIDMDLSLEEDLGLDVEQTIAIAADLTNHHHLSAETPPERLRRPAQRLKTVQDLVRWVEAVSENRADGNPSDMADPSEISLEEEQSETSVFRRYVLNLIEHPLDATEPHSLSGVLMILDGAHPLGKQIQTDAEKLGVHCVRVMHHDHSDPENQDCIRLNVYQEKDYEACYHRLKSRHGKPCGVLNLLSLGKHNHAETYQDVVQSFLWAKTIGADQDLRQGNQWNLFWISVTGMGGDFGLKHVMDFEPTQNGLHGITKCLYHEWPGVRAKTIDIHPEEDLEPLSRFVLGECCENHGTIKEIGFLNHTRHVLVLEDRRHDDGEIRPCLNSDSVLLITGGAKGITAEAAVFLAKRYQPTMIVIGRTPLPERSPEELEAFMDRAASGENDPKSLKSRIIEELKSSTDRVTPALVNYRFDAIMNEYKIRQNIDRMKLFNAKVFYYACDCTNDNDFSELIRKTYKTFHKIDGVIHAAGCLKDAFITQKTTADFKRVLDTKVEGARILLRELDFEHLEFIAFFSSVSGRFGNRGQADYAAANEILNKMAARINHRWPGRAVAVNWGPWAGDGMVTSQLKAQFMKAGVYLLPTDIGARMLNQEIQAPNRISEVVIFGAKDIEKRLPGIQRQSHSKNFKLDLPFVQLFKAKSQPVMNTFCWELDLDQTAPYLNDHRIEEVPVLAAAMAMEIMAQAGLAAGSDFRFKGIQKFDLYKGISLTAGHPRKLTVTVDMQKNNAPDDLIAEVRLTLPNQGNRSNYACQVLLGKDRNDPIPKPMRSTYSRIFRQSIAKMYANRLFHKGVFRALKSIEGFEIADRKNNGIKGIIEPSKPEQVIGEGAGGVWLVDPIVFDCAYQLALLWVQERHSSMGLPSGIKQYRRYRSYNGGPVHCEVAIKKDHFPSLVMDFIFTDERGDLYAKATDVDVMLSKGLNTKLSAPVHEPAKVQP